MALLLTSSEDGPAVLFVAGDDERAHPAASPCRACVCCLCARSAVLLSVRRRLVMRAPRCLARLCVRASLPFLSAFENCALARGAAARAGGRRPTVDPAAGKWPLLSRSPFFFHDRLSSARRDLQRALAGCCRRCPARSRAAAAAHRARRCPGHAVRAGRGRVAGRRGVASASKIHHPRAGWSNHLQ